MRTAGRRVGAQWSRIDSVAVTAVSVLAGGLRLVGITQPGGFVFDEFYASDACLYVFGSDNRCLTTTEISVVHPPLAKWLIGVGIRVLGFSPAAWRLAPVIAERSALPCCICWRVVCSARLSLLQSPQDCSLSISSTS
jgi:dolichyl-phosphate-mannose--protein O-mannosyl transferase